MICSTVIHQMGQELPVTGSHFHHPQVLFVYACILFSTKQTQFVNWVCKKETQGTSLSKRKAIKQTKGETSTSVCLCGRKRTRRLFWHIFRQLDTLRQPLKRGGGRDLKLTGDSHRCYGVCVWGEHSKNLYPGDSALFSGAWSQGMIV